MQLLQAPQAKRYAICDMRYAILQLLFPLSLSLSLNVNIQNLKLFYVEQVPSTKTKLKIVLRGTSAMQLLRVQVGVQT